MNQGGDVLARGGKSAIFGPPKVSQERWDEIFKNNEPQETKKQKSETQREK